MKNFFDVQPRLLIFIGTSGYGAETISEATRIEFESFTACRSKFRMIDLKYENNGLSSVVTTGLNPEQLLIQSLLVKLFLKAI